MCIRDSRVTLRVLAHVEAHQLDAQHLGHLARQLGLADAGGAREQERPDGLLGVAEAGAVVVPRLATDIVRTLANGQVEFEHRANEGVVSLSGGHSSFTLNCLQAPEFPELPADDGDGLIVRLYEAHNPQSSVPRDGTVALSGGGPAPPDPDQVGVSGAKGCPPQPQS